MTHRGAFIVFEGLDRAGKTTQAELLAQRLSNVCGPVVQMRFPDYTLPGGPELRAYLTGRPAGDDDVRTSHLLFCANRSAAITKIKTLLAAGITIVCDRYVYSGIAYSVAKGLSMAWCIMVERCLPQPDIVLYIDCPIDVIACRKDFGAQLHDSVTFLKLVSDAYSFWQETDNSWVTIKGNDSIEDISAKVFEHVKPVLEKLVNDLPLREIFILQ